MGSLLTSLNTAANAMDVIEQAMGVVQNNVSNASTPGYVTQSLNLAARAFDPENNMWGGVDTAGVADSRNQFAEEAVWNQNQLLGEASQQATSLSSLESVFDVSGKSGIPAALSSLYSAFSAWSTTPADPTVRQQVIAAAQTLGQAFSQTASNINRISAGADQQLSGVVDQINQISSQIAEINQQIRSGSQHDAGLHAQLYNSLEQLSNLTGISVLQENDGTVSVLMGGQVPLVMGGTHMQVQVVYLGSAGPPPPLPNSPPSAHIISASNRDVTSIVNGGQLAAVLQFRNVTIPSVIGGDAEQGSLNQLAQAIADTVNGLLTSGQTASGTPGTPLFQYSSGSPTSVAATLSVTPGITGSQLAAAAPGPPLVSNGIADQLAQLANYQDGTLNGGMSYTDFYSSVATDIGSQSATASSAQQMQADLLAQAQNMRAQLSGVSLNDQAAKLLQLQQAYEASAQMISVINNTTQSLMQMMEQIS